MHCTCKAGLALALLTVGMSAAHAQVTFVTSQATLGGNDTINWESYGYSADAFPASTNLLTSGGVTFNITNPIESGFTSADPRGPLFYPGNPEPTDFTPGESAEALRSTYSSPNAEIRINFLTPVSAVGAQLENRNTNHSIGPTFTGFVSAYNGTTLLGTFSETHTTQNLQDGSAPFLGVLSSTANITSVVYYVTQNNEFYIGPVSLNATPAPVPEASSVVSLGLLLILGLGGAAVSRRRRASTVR